MNDPKPALAVPEAVRAGVPTVWRNPLIRPAAEVLPTLRLQWSDVQAAQARWRRFAPLLAKLFPELRSPGGSIDSALLEPKETFARAVLGGAGRLLVKADHDLPVTGCSDAKAWKKDRLRRIGVNVVEHEADYTAAVAAARSSAAARPDCHFVDDETSEQLFLGYATAATDLQAQLEAASIVADTDRPLLVYLPCGVGGAVHSRRCHSILMPSASSFA